MSVAVQRLLTRSVWAAAVITAIVSARYLFLPPQYVHPPEVFTALERWIDGDSINVRAAAEMFGQYPLLVRLHVAGGVVAILAGLFQFSAPLRAARPRLHRALGRVYLVAVLISGFVGLPVAWLSMGPYPAVIGPSFGLLAVMWLFTSFMAYARARQRRYSAHSAWMLRSYSLTFAAFTVRIVAGILLLLTRDLVVATYLGILSWPMNLVLAEWLIRRAAHPASPKIAAAAAR